MEAKLKARPMFESAILRRAWIDAIRKLDPRQQVKNPVMFVVLVGAILTTILITRDALEGVSRDM